MSTRRERLPQGLYALCDDGVRSEVPLEDKAVRLLDGGVRVLQLRMKRTPEARAVEAARTIATLCRARGAVCLVNDWVDLALLAGADGVHVGEEDLPPAEARRLLGSERLLGVTVRSLEEAHMAHRAGADHVGLGPIFASATKAVGVPPLGLAELARIAADSPVPVVAISGIGLSNIAEVAAAGAHCAAVLSDLLAAPDIAGRARALAEAFESGKRQRSLRGE